MDHLKRKAVIICTACSLAWRPREPRFPFCWDSHRFAQSIWCWACVRWARYFIHPLFRRRSLGRFHRSCCCGSQCWSRTIQSGAFILGLVLDAVLYAALFLPVVLMDGLAGAVAACLSAAVVKTPNLPRQTRLLLGIFRELREGAEAYLRNGRLGCSA